MRKQIPSQKKPYLTKLSFEKWQKPTIKGYIEDCIYLQDSDDRKNIIENYNLDNGILSEESVELYSNPFKIQGNLNPTKMQHYPASTIRIDLLVGEESRRRLDYFVVATNPNAISAKQNTLKEEMFNRLMLIAQNENINETEREFKINELIKWSKFGFRDLAEVAGTHLLEKVKKDIEFDVITNRCMRDLLISGREIANIDIVGNKLTARRVFPRNIFPIMSGDSQYIDDAEAILEVDYYTPGKIVDMYQDVLTSAQITDIETYGGNSSGGVNSGYKVMPELGRDIPVFTDMHEYESSLQYLYSDFGIGPAWNERGDVRVCKLVWASFRKIGILTYFNPSTGDEETMEVDENFKADISLGQTIKWKWIKEYWKATEIKGDIYVDIAPIPIQLGNGYIGTINAVDNYTIRSLQDRLKPFEYLYNIFLKRLELAATKTLGAIATLDISRKPAFMEFDQWLYYIVQMNLNIEDSFNSTNEGIAAGKIAGNMNAPRNTLQADSSVLLQQSMSMLQYLDDVMSTISGVTRQRLGQIENRETVGGVERAIRQSNNQTEHWFFIHDRFKLRLLNKLLKYAIYLYKDKEQLMQTFMDDAAIEIIKITGMDMLISDLEVKATFSTDESELKSLIKEYAMGALQSDKVLFSDVAKVFRASSNTERIKILENSEEQLKLMRNQEAQQQIAAQQQATLQAQEKQFQQEVYLKQMELEAQRGDNNDEVEKEKIESNERIKDKEINSKERMNTQNNMTKERIATNSHTKPTKKD